MDRDARQPGYSRDGLEKCCFTIGRKQTAAALALFCVLLFSLDAVGCGGGPGGQRQETPPTLTTIDAPGAGMNGTVAEDINSN